MNELVQVNYIDETGKSFKIVPKRYKSNFNKLTLVSDGYKIYCEPIDRVCCDSNDYEDIGLALEWIEEQIRLRIYDTMKNSIRVGG